MGLSKKTLLNMRPGETIVYEKSYMGKIYLECLYVSKVDSKRGVISGRIGSPDGVNVVPLEDLVKNGLAVTKWKSKKYRV